MSGITTGIYCGGPLYTGGVDQINGLRASGFSTIIAWSVHVTAAGDLVFNDTPLVSSGRYVGDSAWPGLLGQLKQSPTSVTRLLFSVGAGGVDDFTHIQALIKTAGTGPDSPLYKSFAALAAAIPVIDGIDFDDEDLYDESTVVQFGQMLNAFGWTITFCPYTDATFWTSCLKSLDGTTPGSVGAFNLQCYAGGTGNEPQQWIDEIKTTMGPEFDARGLVLPGLWCVNGSDCREGQCPEEIEAQFRQWQPTGIRGGWIWLLDDVIKCENSGSCSGAPMGASAYAQAITAGLTAVRD